MLAQNDISLQQVMDATAGSLDSGLLRYLDGTVVGTGGFVDTPSQRLDVRNAQSIATPKDLAQVPIERRNGKEVRLGDVGNVVGGHQPLSGEAVINDGPGLMLIVQKFPNANTVEVTRGVEEAIDQMRPGLPGMHIDTTIFRPATFIEMAIHNLTTALFLGVLLVILILVAFLFEWRTAFISMIAIPLSVIGAVIVLMMRDTTINTMLLAGLIVSVGVVVDDAIIDVENIVRRLRQARAEGSNRSTFSIVLEASVEVRTAIAYATLINVVAVVPVFFLGGLSGAVPHPPLQRARETGIPPLAGAQARLRNGPLAGNPHAVARDLHRRRRHAGRRRGGANARAVLVSELQGEGLPHALDDQARYVGSGRGADVGSGL